MNEVEDRLDKDVMDIVSEEHKGLIEQIKELGISGEILIGDYEYSLVPNAYVEVMKDVTIKHIKEARADERKELLNKLDKWLDTCSEWQLENLSAVIDEWIEEQRKEAKGR